MVIGLRTGKPKDMGFHFRKRADILLFFTASRKDLGARNTKNCSSICYVQNQLVQSATGISVTPPADKWFVF
jgi:hypothetical protein